MFNRKRKTSTVINILLILYWCEIYFVSSADLLKFWEPDPEIEGRRAVEARQRYRNKIEIFEKPFRNTRGLSINEDDDKTETETHHSHNKAHHKTNINNHTKDEESHRSSTKDQRYSRDERHTRNKYYSTQRSRSKANRDDPLRSRQYAEFGENPDVVKPKHVKRKNRRDSQPYESTRMTPMYLMQVTNEEVTTAKSSSYKYELSPHDIVEQMKEISEKFPEVNVTQEIIGRTVEYNDILLLKITARKSEVGKYFRAEDTKYTDEAQDKKIVFIVHGLSAMGMNHLRCLSSMDHFFILLSYYFAHLDKFDIFLIPLANPDGFAVTKFQQKEWNKNMSPQNACLGVALDRNFEVAWNATKDMSSCTQLYPGPSAFSEIEARAIRDVFHHYSHRIIAYFHVHSGTFSSASYKGDAILYPRGYTDIQTDDDKYIDLKGEVDEAMKNASFQVISATVDTLYNWYTKVSGTSVDYASTVYGIPYAMELVMQLYENNVEETEPEYNYDYLALTEVWRRLIDVIFNNMWRNTHANTDTK